MGVPVLALSAGLKIVGDLLNANANKGNAKDTDKYLNANFRTSGSITKLIKTLIIEPTIIVSEEAYQSKALDAAANSALDIFTSFYTQAFDILTKIHGKSAVETIDVLSTNNYKTNDLVKIAGSKAAYKGLSYAAGALGYDLSTEDLKRPVTLNQLDFNSPAMYLNDEELNILKVCLEDITKAEKNSVTDGAYIRSIRVTIKSDAHGIIEIPLTIVGSIKKVTQAELIKVVEDQNAKYSMYARWLEYRSGGISLGDFIFCNDLIREYKKNRLDKNSSLLGNLTVKDFNSAARQVLTGVKGAEASFGIVIISDNDANYISKTMRNDITKFNGKEKYLSVMQAHNLVILNDDTERCVMLISDLQGEIDTGYAKLMKRSNSGSDNSIYEMMKYMLNNKVPTF
jgi:hypothetical protein